MKIAKGLIVFVALIFLPGVLFSQTNTYILNGSAVQNTCNCYTLTPAVNTQSGSVWNATKINLNNPFDFVFNVYLGCADASGADGIVFMLQPISTSIGTTGEGMGFEGISPSIGISLDTWQNTNRNDPAFDHISIQANGNITHGSDLAGPVQASPSNPNIEDCQWHTFRIVWNPSTKLLSTYFDGNFMLQANVDLIANIFNNDPMVYWGFSAGTGGANNLQQFCTALNPGFSSNITANTTCLGNPVTFTNTSQSFAPIASYFWDFGDGTTSTVANPPPHLYTAAGMYNVKLAIKGLDGCNSDTLRKTIIIGDYPIPDFDIYDTCAGAIPRLIDRSTVTVGTVSQWNWVLNGTPISVSQQPLLSNLSADTYHLQLSVTSSHGCASATTVTKQFTIKRSPVIEAQAAGACINIPVVFTARQMDNATWIDQWNWDFGNGQTSTTPTSQSVYAAPGNYDVTVSALERNGCRSNSVMIPLLVHAAIANAGNDTTILRDIPFPLQSSYATTGTGSVPPVFLWDPSTGLDNPSVANPVATLQDDQVYYFTVTSAEGCVGKDTINITVFKGSAIYVPTGFTPNNDGLNEKLKPSYIGIKSLAYFTVYNRWGEMVFTTKDLRAGWDGIFKGVPQSTGTYVWLLKAVDYAGKSYQMKGTSTIIR